MGSNVHEVAGSDINSDWISRSVTVSKCDKTVTLRGCMVRTGYEAVDCRMATLSRKKSQNQVLHRLCGTGISYTHTQYRGIMHNLRHGGTFPWMCQLCSEEVRRSAVTAEGGGLENVSSVICLPAHESIRKV